MGVFLTKNNQIEQILIHLYARVEQELPLFEQMPAHISTDPAIFQSDSLYQKIKQEVMQGKNLSDSLAYCTDLPDFFLKLVKTGEESCNLSKALRIMLSHFTIYTRYHFFLKSITTYISIIMICLLAMFFYCSNVIVQILAITDSSINLAGIYRINYLASDVHLQILIAGVIIAVIAVFYRFRLFGTLLRFIPVLRGIYTKLLSLEIGTLCEYYMELGFTLYKALEMASLGIKDKAVCRALKKCVFDLQAGQPLSKSLLQHKILYSFPIISTIGLGETTGQAQTLVKEANAFMYTYLTDHMDGEMKYFFKWTIAGCGLLVGIATLFIFQSIVHSYSFL